MASEPEKLEQPRESATVLMAKHIMEELQESGEREFIKDWLIEDLESKGWKSRMFRKAAEITAEESRKNEANTSVPGKDQRKGRVLSSSMKTYELAERLANFGHDSVPSSVRAKLLNQLLGATRKAIQTQQLQPTIAKP